MWSPCKVSSVEGVYSVVLCVAGSPVLREKGWPELPVGVLAPPGVSRRIANTEKMRLWSYSPAGTHCVCVCVCVCVRERVGV